MGYYHVQIERKNTEHSSFEMDLSEEKLLEYIVKPYHKGKEFFCGGTEINPYDVEHIRISRTDRSFKELKPVVEKRDDFAYIVGAEFYVVDESEDVTREFIKHTPRREIKKVDNASKSLSKNIFIVHGHDDKPKLELARILGKLDFNAIILSEQPNKGRTIIEKLEQETIDIGFAFVILTPDDVGCSADYIIRGPLVQKPRARQNVILELGYFAGKIGRDRVCCLHKGDIELPSDIHGIVYIPFKETVNEVAYKIVKELKAAGYEIKI